MNTLRLSELKALLERVPKDLAEQDPFVSLYEPNNDQYVSIGCIEVDNVARALALRPSLGILDPDIFAPNITHIT